MTAMKGWIHRHGDGRAEFFQVGVLGNAPCPECAPAEIVPADELAALRLDAARWRYYESHFDRPSGKGIDAAIAHDAAIKEQGGGSMNRLPTTPPDGMG